MHEAGHDALRSPAFGDERLDGFTRATGEAFEEWNVQGLNLLRSEAGAGGNGRLAGASSGCPWPDCTFPCGR